LHRLIPYDPDHLPLEIELMEAFRQRHPVLPQVACFDTAFHRTMPRVASLLPIPRRYEAAGVRRYGFHGLSYEFIASRLPQVAPQIAGGRVIVAHVGSGASMCALSAGRSVESTMGFTALDGLPMGTRPGQIDPGVVFYLIDQKRMSVTEVQKLFYHECGLKGLSGVSNDVRELEASADPKAAFALDYFAYRVGLNAGMLAAALGGIDGFVFTAGIGENSPSMRARIAKTLAWLGIELDPSANATHGPLISRPDSRVAVYVLPTDEELMIARHTLALLAEKGARKLEKMGTA
jgi:acetate kinase